MDGIYDLFATDDDTVAKERAAALQSMLRGNQQASGLAALSGAKAFQPFAQMTGQMANQQGDALAQAGGNRLRLAMQKREHAEARADRAANREDSQAFRMALAGQQQAAKEDTTPVDPALAAEIRKTGVNPGVFKNRGEAMKYLLQPRAGNLDLANRKFDDARTQRDELTPAQTGEIADLDTGLKMLDDIEAQKSQIDTGPVSDMQNRLASTFGVADPAKSAFRAKVYNDLAQYILAQSGRAASDSERRFLAQVTPAMSDNDDQFSAKLTSFRNFLSMKRQTKLENFAKSGRDTSNFTGGTLGAPLTDAQTTPAAPAGGTDPHASLRAKYGL